MRVESIVHRLCRPAVSAVHANRVRAVVVAATAVVWAGRLSVSRIGRAVRGPTSPKHSIKRIDRLLSNHQLWRERTTFFRSLAGLVVRGDSPTVLVDWTKLPKDQHALVAAVPVGGRALPIYSEVHRERLLGNPRVQDRFLRQLAMVLPTGCIPVIVADAGFKTPFFASVRMLGWQFVVRLRGRLSPQVPSTQTSTALRTMFEWATEVPFDLGHWRLASRESSTTVCRIILAGRPRRRRRAHGQRPNWASERKAARGAKEPWVLATSIDDASPKAIADIYATRMQIEETFRDTKDHRFGWALIQARSSSPRRTDVLLLLAAFANVAVVLCGLAAERLGLHRRYQANTVQRRVLSLFALGIAVISRLDTRLPLHRLPLDVHGRQP